jgi:hypothetical protein
MAGREGGGAADVNLNLAAGDGFVAIEWPVAHWRRQLAKSHA